jgi:GT2 family glycosyltransferase
MNTAPVNKSIAAVLACHNRRELTLACLRAFFAAEVEYRLAAYVFDDGSCDGTADAIRAEFPDTTIIPGDGSAFWNRGMWRAFGAALDVGHHYYLWLNDDGQLDPGFLKRMLVVQQAAESSSSPAIVVGALRSDQGEVAYGGQMLRGPGAGNLTTVICPSSQQPQACDTFHGNCVLIPKSAVERVGNIDPRFFHNYGDFDYGLRARKAGCSILQAPDTVGVCNPNGLKQRLVEQLQSGSLTQRWRAFGQTRLIHMPSRIRYFVRHLGLWGLLVAVAPLRHLSPFIAKHRK